VAKYATLEFYANDTKPELDITLDDGDTTDPQPIDLTDVANVAIKVAKNFDAADNLFVGNCEIVGDPADGHIKYQFQSGELVRGGWLGEITLIYNDYKVLTVGHFKLKVLPDLPGVDY